MIRVEQPTREALAYIVANLREQDRLELDATTYALDDGYVGHLWALRASQWVVSDGLPAAVIGAWPRWPGVWGVYAFGTDAFESVALTLTKHVRRHMIPAMLRAGCHRAECASIESHHRAHRWLERLGAKREGPPMLGYGKRGEAFIRFVWREADVQRAVRD